MIKKLKSIFKIEFGAVHQIGKIRDHHLKGRERERERENNCPVTHLKGNLGQCPSGKLTLARCCVPVLDSEGHASPSSEDAHSNRQLTLNFEL